MDCKKQWSQPKHFTYNAILLVSLDLWFYSDYRCYFCDLAQAVDFPSSYQMPRLRWQLHHSSSSFRRQLQRLGSCDEQLEWRKIRVHTLDGSARADLEGVGLPAIWSGRSSSSSLQPPPLHCWEHFVVSLTRAGADFGEMWHCCISVLLYNLFLLRCSLGV